MKVELTSPAGYQFGRTASGHPIEVAPGGKARLISEADLDLAFQADAEYEGPTCSLCDAVGHGYPGGGPCPLEERGYWDAEADLQRYGSY